MFRGVGRRGTATFDVSNRTTIDISSGLAINSLVFNAGASAYTFSNATFSLSGAGIVNNSSQTQTINIGTGATLNFFADSTAGNARITNANGATLSFQNSGSAGAATITNTAIADAWGLYLRYDGEVGTGIDNHVFKRRPAHELVGVATAGRPAR